MSEAIDLSGFDVRPRSQEGASMRLLAPDGQPTRVVLRVRGRDAQAYQDMIQAQIRRAVERAPVKSTEQEKNAEFWELQATLVAGWFNLEGQPAKIVVEANGAPLEYTPANAAAVLEKHSWIFEQVNRFADKRANFLPGSASS